MNTPADPIAFNLFEAFHGSPAAAWDSAQPWSPSKVFEEPAMLDLNVPEDAGRLAEFGLARQHVEAIAGDDPAMERELRRQILGETFVASAPESEVDERTRTALMSSGVRYLPYIETILESGHFLTLCPVSGRPVKSTGSFVVDTHHIAYRFKGDVVFYLLVGRFH